MTTKPDEPDVMAKTWCCLTCHSKFRFGQIRMRDGGLGCPHCDAGTLYTAEPVVETLDRYDGEVGTLN